MFRPTGGRHAVCFLCQECGRMPLSRTVTGDNDQPDLRQTHPRRRRGVLRLPRELTPLLNWKLIPTRRGVKDIAMEGRPKLQPRVGCAGWTIPKQYAGRFREEGSHLVRYRERLNAVEVNSCFYRSHRPSTYARWAIETPADFAFSLKLPKEVTHARRLVKTDEALSRFLNETAELGTKRGPILVQLPPSLSFDAKIVGEFFTGLRRQYDGDASVSPGTRAGSRPSPRRC